MQPAEPIKSNATEAGKIARFARRTRLIREKLDPQAGWVEHRHPVKDANGKMQYCVEVERKVDKCEPRIVKSMGGFMSRLQKHETSAYLAVWQESNKLTRVATFQQLSAEGDQKIIVLKDYGPSLEDWFSLTGPPRLHPDFRDQSLPLLNSSASPWLAPAVLLALARSLLEALEPFHALGFVHCDAKADNFCIRFKTTTQRGPALSGEIDLDTLTAIDLGCSLLPMLPARCIYLTEEGGAPLYIGAPYRQQYLWPVLMGGATDEKSARLVAQRYASGEFPRELNTHGGRDARKQRLGEAKARDLGYISDNYLLACEMAALGELSALAKLDWRIDFFSLGQLLKNLRRNLTHECGEEARKLADTTSPVMNYLDALPQRLQAYDTCPYMSAPTLPHRQIIEEINALIGKEQHRLIPFSIVEAANPIPWYEAPTESPISNLTETAMLPLPPAASETLLRNDIGNPGRPFSEFRDFEDAPWLISLPGGSAQIGSPINEPGRAADEPLPQFVTLQPFALGKFPVTFEQWDQFVAATGYAPDQQQDEDWGRGQRPVINITWHDIAAYLAWLNRIAGWSADDPHRYRLPDAAEWEYAARAGTTTPFYTGDTLLATQAQFYPDKTQEREEASLPFRQTVPVGSFAPNPWHLHDMLGNVWEWVETGASRDSNQMIRGGSWLNGANFLRAAACKRQLAGKGSSHIGFRVARSLG